MLYKKLLCKPDLLCTYMVLHGKRVGVIITDFIIEFLVQIKGTSKEYTCILWFYIIPIEWSQIITS